MKEQSTGKSFIALSFAGILVKVMSLLYVPIIIRILGDEGYGIYLASYDIFSLIYVVTNSGMQIAIAKQIAEFVALNQQQNVVKTFYVGKRILFFIGLISSLILLLTSKIMAELVSSQRSYLGIVFLSPTIFFTSVLAAYRGFFQGISNMTPVAFSQVLEQVCNIFISVFFAFTLVNKSLELGAAGGTIGTTVGAFFAIVFLCYVLRKDKIIYNMSNSIPYLNCELERRDRVSTKQIVKTFLKYGIPVILTSGIQYVGAVIDLALVKNRLLVAGFDSNASDILYGLLGKYKTLIYVPLAFIAALSAAVIPSIVKSVVLKDNEELFNKIRFALKISFLISIPACVGLSILSKPIYSILFSQEYSDGYRLMLYGSTLVIFMSVVQIQTTILQGVNKFYSVFLSLFLGVIIKLLSNYFFVGINFININGAVIGSILGFFIPMIINDILIKKYTGFRSKMFSSMLKPILASVFMGIIVLFSYNFFNAVFNSLSIGIYISFIFSVVLGCSAYFLLIVVLKYIKKSDLDFMPNAIVNRIPKKIMSKFFK